MNLQRSDSRKLVVAEGVRQHRRNVSRGTSGVLLVRLRLRGWPKIMEQQVGALIQQVMEMNERMRRSEEAAEQARHWEDAGGTNETNGSECDRYVSSWWD